MFDPELLEKYRSMADAEKIAAIRMAIHMDEKPLGVLLAILAIIEPDRVESIFEKLTSISHHQTG